MSVPELQRALERPFKPMSPKKFRHLLTQAQAGNMLAKRRLVLHNIRFIAKIAGQYHHDSPAIAFDDCLQIAIIGFLSALQGYNPDLGKFTTYVGWSIRRTLRRDLDNQDADIRVPVNRLRARRRAHRAEDALLQQHATLPDKETLAAHAGLTPDQLRAAFDVPVVDCSLDDPVGDNGDLSRADVVAQPLHADTSDVADMVLETLAQPGADYVLLRFGLHPDYPGQVWAIHDIAAHFRVRVDNVSTTIASGLAALKSNPTFRHATHYRAGGSP